ncbi:hypothetical protein ACPCUV_00620 [Streptomyces platensis]|uniref:hypothetical protein n=1 Tax=Streptomyces platensis TaxID=58346 RepID=UPI003C2BA1EE
MASTVDHRWCTYSLGGIMTAILGATTQRVILVLAPALIACATLESPDTVHVSHQAVAAHPLGNQDWV